MCISRDENMKIRKFTSLFGDVWNCEGDEKRLSTKRAMSHNMTALL